MLGNHFYLDKQTMHIKITFEIHGRYLNQSLQLTSVILIHFNLFCKMW